MPEWRNRRETKAGMATYSLEPRAVVAQWLLIDISQTSNSADLKARWNDSSGSSATACTSQPST